MKNIFVLASFFYVLSLSSTVSSCTYTGNCSTCMKQCQDADNYTNDCNCIKDACSDPFLQCTTEEKACACPNEGTKSGSQKKAAVLEKKKEQQ